MFEDLLERWDGEHAVVRHDAPSGAWMLVCLHSTRLGPAMGGTRLKSYATPAEALEDAMRLSAGMTRKLAVLGLPCGGGKAVVAVPSPPEGEERRLLLQRYGDLIASLGGSFVTGPDVNTGEADMNVIGERTPYVFCRSVERGGSGDPSIHTALGVFHGLRATVERAFGSGELGGRTVLVQGAGSVGAKLAQLLLDAGATVLVSDVDEERARATGGTVVPAEAALETDCDVYAPCALGATLNADSIPRLRCRVVAGAANNQLGDARGRRAPRRGRHPLRARLRDQRWRRAARDRARAAPLGRGDPRPQGRRDRRHADERLRRGRRGGNHDRRRGRAPRRRSASPPRLWKRGQTRV